MAHTGLIGLGVMGGNLALNIADHGHHIAVYNRTASKSAEFVASAGELGARLTACDTLVSLVETLQRPRMIILMVTAGEVVDAQIAALRPLLDEGDTIIDAGNANYHDTRRRTRELADSPINFVGMGVSGGEEGARFGPAIMVGGDSGVFPQLEPVLSSIAARYNDEPCCAHVGQDGAGHFVKTLHNGIEYADMQMIAEVYELMSCVGGASAAQMGDVFEQWNRGALESYLIEITASVLKAVDPDSGQPMVEVILDRAGQKGTGGWASIESIAMGAPATTLIEAVGARAVSSMLEQRQQAAAIYPSLEVPDLVPMSTLEPLLSSALLAGKVCAYAQGFAVMQAASVEYRWQLPMAEIAKIWRAGCIIRSGFLDDIASAFSAGELANLLQAEHFVKIMSESHQPLRQAVAIAAHAGVPVPALSAALAYFDGYRRAKTSASLIQGQRDFFGAHGFERRDRDGRDYHGPWGMAYDG